MKNNRPKLRLRKGVIISIPVLLLISIITIGIIVSTNRHYESEVDPIVQTSPNVEVDENQSFNLDENIYFQNLNNYLNIRQKDNTVVYYANMFKLNTNRVVEIAHELTNNYSDPKYLETNVIATDRYKDSYGPYDSFEAGVVQFVRNIYSYPERYGSSIDEIRSDYSITTNNNYVDGKLIMSNGLTFEQYYGKICDMFGVNKSIALGIVYQESGIRTSSLFKNSNNIGGLRGGSGWMKFPTLESGVIVHVLLVKKLADQYGIDMNSPYAIGQLSGIYVYGDINSYAEDWTNKVTYFKNSIEAKGLFN
jgi:hypothetical protein